MKFIEPLASMPYGCCGGRDKYYQFTATNAEREELARQQRGILEALVGQGKSPHAAVRILWSRSTAPGFAPP
ncbi:hypothetical protein [Streptomyces sp. NPDC096013]|uniref:hypothetical protein n=1 Tax=Streptomyces sp. NPDC096013 TaxID=3366069 RepID=UPI0037F259FD